MVQIHRGVHRTHRHQHCLKAFWQLQGSCEAWNGLELDLSAHCCHWVRVSADWWGSVRRPVASGVSVLSINGPFQFRRLSTWREQ